MSSLPLYHKEGIQHTWGSGVCTMVFPSLVFERVRRELVCLNEKKRGNQSTEEHQRTGFQCLCTPCTEGRKPLLRITQRQSGQSIAQLFFTAAMGVNIQYHIDPLICTATKYPCIPAPHFCIPIHVPFVIPTVLNVILPYRCPACVARPSPRSSGVGDSLPATIPCLCGVSKCILTAG